MRRVSLLLALLLAMPSVASAAIAVFSDGRSMKVDSYAVRADLVQLNLDGGASLSVPLGRVERIVDDEVVTPEVVETVAAAATDDGVLPTRSWRYHPERTPLFRSKFDAEIVRAAKRFDVDAALVSAVIKAESDYNPQTISHKGARGLMQLMPATAARFGVTDSFDPVANIHGGTRYLGWLLKTFEGNADLAVAAYNAGEGNVWKYNGVPPFRETVNYVRKIGKHLRAYELSASAGSGESLRVAALR